MQQFANIGASIVALSDDNLQDIFKNAVGNCLYQKTSAEMAKRGITVADARTSAKLK